MTPAGHGPEHVTGCKITKYYLYESHQIAIIFVILQLEFAFTKHLVIVAGIVRTFHHRFTLGAKGGIITFVVLAFYFFWVKSFVLGLLLTVMAVLIMERVLHSEYVLADGKLIIRRGRFAKSRAIALRGIKSCRPMTTTFGLVHYLLIEYGDNKLVVVEPEQEQAFVEQLRKGRG